MKENKKNKRKWAPLRENNHHSPLLNSPVVIVGSPWQLRRSLRLRRRPLSLFPLSQSQLISSHIPTSFSLTLANLSLSLLAEDFGPSLSLSFLSLAALLEEEGRIRIRFTFLAIRFISVSFFLCLFYYFLSCFLVQIYFMFSLFTPLVLVIPLPF